MQNIPQATLPKTVSEWLDYMGSIHVSAIDMGLERVLPVAHQLGILKKDLPNNPYIFTVAGTNGKGSTTALISEICINAGYKTALYQSPHLISFNERIKTNGVEIDDELLIQAFHECEKARVACGLSLSFFEMTTLAAFVIFKHANADVWVLEIGLGGRLDVVNIIDPDVAVITNIGIDHVDWLGDDIEKIGFEKAGIIRDGIPTILGARQLPNSVHETANAKNAKAYQLGVDYDFIENDDSWQYSSQGITLRLPKPKLSLLNAVNAVSAVLASSLGVDERAIVQGLAQVQLAGRFDYRQIDGRQWLFDVAHNAHGMAFLLSQFIPYWQTYQKSHPNARLHIVFSMLGDKDIGAVLDLLQDKINDGLTVTTWHIAAIDHVRAMPLNEILALVNQHLTSPHIKTYDSLDLATKAAKADSDEQDLVLVFGSFHTVGEVLVSLLGKTY